MNKYIHDGCATWGGPVKRVDPFDLKPLPCPDCGTARQWADAKCAKCGAEWRKETN